MHSASTPIFLNRLAGLRTTLIDLAYDLDVSGALAAADVAMTTSARIAELCDEFSTQPSEAKLELNSTALSETSHVTR